MGFSTCYPEGNSPPSNLLEAIESSVRASEGEWKWSHARMTTSVRGGAIGSDVQSDVWGSSMGRIRQWLAPWLLLIALFLVLFSAVKGVNLSQRELIITASFALFAFVLRVTLGVILILSMPFIQARTTEHMEYR